MIRYGLPLVLATVALAPAAFADDPQPLAIGAAAPDFDLPGVDGKNHTLKEYADAKILAIVFTCNHCPTAQSYEERIRKIVDDYADKGVAVVAISPSSPLGLRLDELGYTDLDDSFESMKIRARDNRFNFPYLYDGDDQAVSRAYGPQATPHVFVFDPDRKLQYVGRIDDNEREALVRRRDLRSALDTLLVGGTVDPKRTRSSGCSTKWKTKKDSVDAFMAKLAAEPVTLEGADAGALKALRKNDSGKLRLVNVWSIKCGPCRIEFPELVTINRMYRQRAFEFVSVCTDYPDEKKEALDFLTKQQASNRNLIATGEDRDATSDAIDKDWSGALPFTLLLAPGGEVLYRREGPIDPLELKRAVVKTLGRSMSGQ